MNDKNQNSYYTELKTKYLNLRSKFVDSGITFGNRIKIASEIINGLKCNDLYFYRRNIDSNNSTPKNHFINSLINLASNDYLSFSKHPGIINSSSEYLQKCGVGSGSVPMLAGTQSIHKKLDDKIANFTGYQSAICFSSGFAANYGLLTSILTPSDVVILDTYVHASIIEGCWQVKKSFFLHNNLESLKSALHKNAAYKNKLIVVDGVYSMDGDIAKLNEIIEIARDNGAWVVVDESHAIGVIGNQGRGTQDFLKIKDKAEIITCSLGKALGAIGGFVAGSEDLINLLELTCRPFIYSTALPPNNAASIIKAFELLENNDHAIQKLWSNIGYFKNKIQLIQKEFSMVDTAIFPLIIKDEHKLLKLCDKLYQNQIFVNPIFYPVVPKKKSRIRLSLTASLTHSELDFAFEKMAYYYKKLAI